MKLGEQGLYVNKGGQIKNPHSPPSLRLRLRVAAICCYPWREVDIIYIMRHQQR